MKLVSLIDSLRERLGLVIKLCIGVLALVVILDILRVVLGWGLHEEVAEQAAGQAAQVAEHGEQAAEASHGFLASLYHVAETVPVFWTIFGFIACVLIVFVSKWIGHVKIGKFQIMTREDYYNE